MKFVQHKWWNTALRKLSACLYAKVKMVLSLFPQVLVNLQLRPLRLQLLPDFRFSSQWSGRESHRQALLYWHCFYSEFLLHCWRERSILICHFGFMSPGQTWEKVWSLPVCGPQLVGWPVPIAYRAGSWCAYLPGESSSPQRPAIHR